MSDEEDLEEVTSKGSKGKMIGIIGAVAVAIGLAGGGGYYAATMGDDAADETLDEGEEGQLVQDTTRVVLPLEPFSVNLRGSGAGRVLKLEVHLEVASTVEEEVTERTAMLRDSVLGLASDYTVNDLEGIDGKTQLRDELLQRLNAALAGPRIERIYFTDLVVQ